MNNRYRYAGMAVFTLLLLLLNLTVVTPSSAAGGQIFKDVPGQHWGYASISWAVEQGIAQGDGLGSFRPGTAVTEPEFLAMLMRLYPEIELPLLGSAGKWYEPYYNKAYMLDWPVGYMGSDYAYSRGRAAELIAAAASGQAADTNGAIQYLLDHGLAKGKTSNSITGFGADDTITRAEAVTLLKNLKDKLPSLMALSAYGLKLSGIAIGGTEGSVVDRLGQPDRQDPSEYGFTWYIYNKNYTSYAQIGIVNGKVVALYSNASGVWSSDKGIKDGITADALSAILSQSIEPASKLFATRKLYENATFFLDTHDSLKVDAIFVMSRLTAEQRSSQPDGESGDKLARAYERQVFDLTNVFRLKNGVRLLQWDDQIAGTARKHSQDMRERAYFEHTNPDGKSPFDRMKADGISYSWAAENIAYGYGNAIEVHNGWLNSAGHRNNMLNANLQRLGVGIYEHYYTQNFYTPK